MSTYLEFNDDAGDHIAIDSLALCDAIAEANKGLVTVTPSQYHICELRGVKYRTWHDLAAATGVDIFLFLDSDY